VTIDDPTVPEFASWDSYSAFARSIRQDRRYLWTPGQTAFLDTVRATVQDRDVDLAAGVMLYRAQRGIDWLPRTDDNGNDLGEEPMGFGRNRMKPLPYQATEGRANPAGVPVLYLGTTAQTAVSEVRPWIGSPVSLARFRISRPLRVIDLSRGHGRSSFMEVGLRHLGSDTPVGREEKEKAVWIDIDTAFSRPVVASEASAEYAPTQILAELFRDIGYDAVAYRSQFGLNGFNVAVFDVGAAEPVTCAPFEVTEVAVSFEQVGNDWYASAPPDSMPA
jgi:hypothetical protein